MKLSLFVDGMICHMENPKEFTKNKATNNFLNLSEFSNVTGYKINTQQSTAFHTQSNSKQVEQGN